MMSRHPGNILAFSIHRAEAWWREIARHIGFDRITLISDLRGDGDICVVDDFYAAYNRLSAAPAPASALLDEDAVEDVIARCRVLRWLPRRQAVAMALAMAEVMDSALDAEQPVAVVSWPIDRYVKDVLARMAARRRIPFFELTVSPVPGMTMLVHRGKLLTRDIAIDPADVEAAVTAIADPLFVPSYVPRKAAYTRTKFLRVFSYFWLRSAAFKAISHLKRDPLNLHYLDAQFFLGHKPRLGDIRMIDLIDRDWRQKMEAVPREKRLFMALQLFPEASIDYWIEARDLIDHEQILISAAHAFSRAGYVILVKDHPLQFGFRQIELIERLRAISGVIIVPYEVNGSALLADVAATFTETGTLGMQAALLGLKSITVDAYFHTAGDFVLLSAKSEVPDLPRRLEAIPEVTDLAERQRRIVSHLLRGSFPGDFMSFRGFDPKAPNPAVAVLAARLGDEIAAHLKDERALT